MFTTELMDHSKSRGPQSLRSPWWWRKGSNRCRCCCKKKARKAKSLSRTSFICHAKTGLLNIFNHACLGIHRFGLPALQRFHPLHPSHQWRQIRRWLNLPNVSQLSHHCRAWNPWSAARWRLSRDPQVWTERHACCFHRFDWSLSLRLNYSIVVRCAARVAVCLQLLLKHHVCRFVRVHT